MLKMLLIKLLIRSCELINNDIKIIEKHSVIIVK